jgi:predicted outer membrane repeat protein
VADNATADTSLTLREAVAVVNGTLGRALTAGEQAHVSGTLGSNDTIQFSLPSGPQTIKLISGALSLTKAVTVNGPGAGNLTVSGNNSDRVFIVGHNYSQNLSLKASINGLTVSGGSALSGSNNNYGAGILNFGTLTVNNATFTGNAAGSSGGGGIYNDGALSVSNSTFSGNSVTNVGAGAGILNTTSATLTVTSCVFSGNTATSGSSGGGIANSGTLTVTNSTFSGNTVDANGAGIHNSSTGKLNVSNSVFVNGKCTSDGGAYDSDGTSTVSNCTFANNTVGSEGGAIDNHGTLQSVTNSTFVGNSSVSRGGAINCSGSIQIVNCTIVGNRVTSSSGRGGGLLAGTSTTVDNTIVAGNFQGPGTTPGDISGTVTSNSAFNLIGTGGSGGLTNGTNGNQVGVTNPGLGSLANNGGPGQTMALLPGSPALDRGGNAYVTAGGTDQRGFARVVNGTVDIGAFEMQTTLTAPADQNATVGTAQGFALGSFADANSAASPWNVDVSWGDGSPDTAFTASSPGALGTQNHAYQAAGTFTATVTVSDADHDTSKATFHVNVTVPTGPTVSSLTVTGFSSPIQAGVAGAVTVTARDTNGNVVTGYRGTIHFTSSDSQAALPLDYTFTAADNGAHTFNLTLETAGSQSVTVTAGSSVTGTQSGIAVTAAAASIFIVSGFPTPTTAGVAGTFTVTARDAYGNTATGYGGTVHFSSSDGQATLPADSTLTSGVGTFSATLYTAGNQTLTATDTATASLTGHTGALAVIPAAAAFFVLNAPAAVTAGAPFTFTVTARDAFNNTATGYSGVVHFTSSDGQATLPADSPLTNGAGSFRATLRTQGSQTLTATDTGNPSLAGTQTGIVVSPASASTFSVTAFPSPTTAGTAATFTVTARDGQGNTATGYLGTIHFTSSDPHALLPADYTFLPGDNGVQTFTVTLVTAGSQSLTATDTTVTGITGTQAGILVTPAAASIFTVSGFPSPVLAGAAGTFTVTAKDSYGNTVTGYNGTVHFTSSDSQAILPADSTLTNGAGSFSATLKTAGSQSLTATDTANASITGTQAGITVNPASSGAVLTVNSTADNTTADSVLTLREAIALVDGTLGRALTAGEQAQVSGTLGKNATIQFSLPAGPQTITLTGGALSITQPVTINGPGAGNLTVNGNNRDRVFIVGQIWSPNPSLTVSLSGLTVAGGNAGYGAGLLNFGTLTVTSCTFANNTATSNGGGGIYNVTALTVTGCTFTGNAVTSSQAGGGIENVSSGTVNVSNCTFSGNSANGSGSGASSGGAIGNSGTMTVTGSTFTGNSAASDGGAIYNDASLTVSTSTFSNNTALSDGGAIRSGGTLTLTGSTLNGNSAGSVGGGLDSSDTTLTMTNCTIACNTAASLGGGFDEESWGGTATLTNDTITGNRVTSGSGGNLGGGVYAAKAVTLYNTIVAGNFQGPAPGTTPDDIGGSVTSSSAFNLIGTGGSGGLVNGVNGNQVGVSNPGLGSLANNGGPTQTIALLPGSLAIDAGSNVYVLNGETDQRGLPRIVNGTVDIGAYEVQ